MLASSLSPDRPDLGCGLAAHSAGLERCRDRVTVAAPPVKPTEQLLCPETEAGELVGALGRGIAADPVAIDHINLRGIEARGRLDGHLAMRQADRTGNVTGRVGLARPRVDDHDRVAAGL